MLMITLNVSDEFYFVFLIRKKKAIMSDFVVFVKLV